VKWGDGGKLFATAYDPFVTSDRRCISIFEFPTEDKLFEAPQNTRRDDPAKLHTFLKEIELGGTETATCLGWTIADQYIIAGFESGFIVKYDVATGKEVKRIKAHEKRVNRINFNRDKSMFITASKDCTAKLMDPFTLEVIKTFVTDRPVNGVAISPTHPHILLGGGQDAQNVTTTDGSQGKFETRFFHSIYGEEFARVRGHFGPINALDVHPFGKSFASGSEDG
jgi:translation initiation factor 3 subunit I